ncbi:polyketide synthase, partial [Streptomyces cacaoi]
MTGTHPAPPDTSASAGPAPGVPVPDDAVAVVGIAVRFPGADSLDAFRRNLRDGVDSVGPMPAERVAATGLDPDGSRLPMGHLADIHTFDHDLFRISRREACLMDPQQRLALLLAHQALEDGGYAARELGRSDTAVVFSSAASAYHAAAEEPGALSALGNMPFGVPARIAHVLGLHGPCYAVDTGCNGSLIAVHHACRELALGEAQYAVAGGVSLRPGGLPAREAAGMSELVSDSGRCRAFDADADGTAPGEGGAALLLTTVGRARADGARVLAVIRGSAVQHNGRATSTMSTPSAVAQARVIARAWRSAGLEPAHAGYLEGHGSGTPLGDAVELEGLAEAFGGRPEPLPLGSVKTNIGHLDHAAGIAGLVKALLGVHHAELYPNLHFRRATGGVEPAELGLDIVTALRPWPAGERFAGVSSFSLGGINAHCVVQQPPPVEPPAVEPSAGQPARTAAEVPAVPADEPGEGRPRLVTVSARSREALTVLCEELGTVLRDSDEDLADVAFTLNHGREHHGHRVAVRARDTEELAVRLAAQATWLRRDPADGPHGAAPRAPRVAVLLPDDARPDDHHPSLPEELARCGVRVTGTLGGTGRGTRAEPESAAAALLAAGPVVFVDASGDDGWRPALDRAAAARGVGADIVPLTARTGGLLGVLGALWSRGVALDWDAVSPAAPAADAGEPGSGAPYLPVPPTRPPRRLRLPGHPVRAVPCWAGPQERTSAPREAQLRPGSPEFGATGPQSRSGAQQSGHAEPEPTARAREHTHTVPETTAGAEGAEGTGGAATAGTGSGPAAPEPRSAPEASPTAEPAPAEGGHRAASPVHGP